MGVVNVTPDSFSDGGMLQSSGAAVSLALRLVEEGADILDVGGESTRPGSKAAQAGAVTAEEECARILPVIEGVLAKRPETIISVDTHKAEVARRAVEAGAQIVNDVSGLTWDPRMAETVAKLECGLVLMHTRGKPEEWKALPTEPRIVQVVKEELASRMNDATGRGIARERIVLDPGFGFGKNMDENLQMLAHFDEFSDLGLPLLAGTSRKSFLGAAYAARLAELDGKEHTPLPAKERLHGTIASLTIAIMKGAHIVRVHDVRPAVEAAAVADLALAAVSSQSKEAPPPRA